MSNVFYHDRVIRATVARIVEQFAPLANLDTKLTEALAELRETPVDGPEGADDNPVLHKLSSLCVLANHFPEDSKIRQDMRVLSQHCNEQILLHMQHHQDLKDRRLPPVPGA